MLAKALVEAKRVEEGISVAENGIRIISLDDVKMFDVWMINELKSIINGQNEEEEHKSERVESQRGSNNLKGVQNGGLNRPSQSSSNRKEVLKQIQTKFRSVADPRLVEAAKSGLSYATGDSEVDSAIAIGFLLTNTGNLNGSIELFDLLLSIVPTAG